MPQAKKIFVIISFITILVPALFLLTSCSERESDPLEQGRVQIDYWEFWTGFEYNAMKDIVNKFNNSQDRIFVNIIGVSDVQRKLLIATAGNDPPDVCHLQDWMAVQLVERRVLEELKPLMSIININSEDYIEIYWQLCRYKGRLYGLPTSPTTLALHWNKTIFEKAGLDPEKPPQSIEELDELAEKMTTKRDRQNFETLGFIQTNPGWWNFCWVFFFGGSWWDGQETVTANCPQNLRAFQWLASYADKYGPRALQNFTGGFGTFSWANDGFFADRLAMVFQGVWLNNFINQYAPDLQWGAAAFPSEGGRLKDVSIAECSIQVIPRNAKHPKEAAEFMSFVQRPENLKYLALKHRKFMPLKIANDMDYSKHPNKEIELFLRLSQSPNVRIIPRIPIWQEYTSEIDNTFQQVWLQKKTPKEALDILQRRMEDKWNDYQRIDAIIQKAEERKK